MSDGIVKEILELKKRIRETTSKKEKIELQNRVSDLVSITYGEF